ncbi:MAG: hypothetical protein WDO72_03170 [Pseudomonadota bacterium]
MVLAADAVDAAQERLLHGARNFVFERMRRKRDVALEPECFMTAWARTPGHARLRRLDRGGWRAEPARLVARARDAFHWLRTPGFALSQSATPGDYDSLIITWALPGDFDSTGNHRDRYLGLSTAETPRTLWLLLMIDGAPTTNPAPNIRMIYKRNRAGATSWPPSVNLNLISNARATRPRARGFSAIVAQAHAVAEAVSIEFRRFPVRRVIVPYEGQPFQHALMLAVKRERPQTETVGYMHAVLPSLPTDYVYRDGAPDCLLVNGEGQAEILREYLGWPTDKVRAVPSLRYMREPEPPFGGHILLPYDCDPPAVVTAFEAYVRASPKASMPAWLARLHPVMARNPKHLGLARQLAEIMARHEDRTSTRAEFSRQALVFGGTAAVLEALERSFDVIHLCATPLFEKHSARVWRHLDVEDLGGGAFRYRLRTPGAYIKFGQPGHGAALLGIDS